MHGRACNQYIFRSYNIYFQCYVLWWKSFHMTVRKKDKNAEGFQISHFYWLFSSDTMAVKGVNSDIQKRETRRKKRKKDNKTERILTLSLPWCLFKTIRCKREKFQILKQFSFLFRITRERVCIKTHRLERFVTGPEKYTVCWRVRALLSPEILQAWAMKGLKSGEAGEDCQKEQTKKQFSMKNNEEEEESSQTRASAPQPNAPTPSWQTKEGRHSTQCSQIPQPPADKQKKADTALSAAKLPNPQLTNKRRQTQHSMQPNSPTPSWQTKEGRHSTHCSQTPQPPADKQKKADTALSAAKRPNPQLTNKRRQTQHSVQPNAPTPSWQTKEGRQINARG